MLSQDNELNGYSMTIMQISNTRKMNNRIDRLNASHGQQLILLLLLQIKYLTVFQKLSGHCECVWWANNLGRKGIHISGRCMVMIYLCQCICWIKHGLRHSVVWGDRRQRATIRFTINDPYQHKMWNKYQIGISPEPWVIQSPLWH